MSRLIASLLCLLLATTSTTVRAQGTAAPVPSQIAEAHSVFLSNGGGDGYFALTYSNGGDRAYNDLYAGIKNWGRFQIVSAPGDADLILEVHSLANESTSTVHGSSTTSYGPQLRLQLLDPKTHSVLWTLDSYIHAGPGRQKTRDKQLDTAASVLITQLRQLVGETLSPAEAKAARSRPGASRGTWIVIGVLAAVAVIVPVAILASRPSQPKIPTLPVCTNPPFCTV